MAVRHAKVVYDFDAEPGSGEISLHAGDDLTVLRTDIGNGWWEGQKANGECGLFPEAYVELFTEAVGIPSVSSLPQDYTSKKLDTSNTVEDWNSDPWSEVSAQVDATKPSSDWEAADDDWDSYFVDETAPQVIANNYSPPPLYSPPIYSPIRNTSGSLVRHRSGSASDVSEEGCPDSKKRCSAKSKTSFNRFSMFVKSGNENFILGKVDLNVQELDKLTIVEHGNGKFSWLNSKPPFPCVIASPKKEAKFKGLKSYTAYQLTPSFNNNIINIQVSRKCTHFDWLHARLCSKFKFVPIPPLPDKQIQGRNEEECIGRRMKQLQSFVDRICQHPVLAQSEVWGHFLFCTDEKRWKSGKKKAEKDPLVGGAMYTAVRVPNKPLESEFVDREVKIFSQFTSQFELAVKNMAKLSAEQTTRCQRRYKREFQLIGKSFSQLGHAMEQDGGHYNPELANAVVATGKCYEEVGRLYEKQPRLDWEQLGDMMHDYKGLLAGWPQVLCLHSASQAKRKEIENDGNVEQTEVHAVQTRTDIVTYALLAEVNTFHEQRVKDIKSSHQHFLMEQIKFYQKITENLQETLKMFDQC